MKILNSDVKFLFQNVETQFDFDIVPLVCGIDSKITNLAQYSWDIWDIFFFNKNNYTSFIFIQFLQYLQGIQMHFMLLSSTEHPVYIFWQK